jgi:1,4-dihydroxy-2-naphthoate octaprenyltransferase
VPFLLLPVYSLLLPFTPWLLLSVPALIPAWKLSRDVHQTDAPETLVTLPLRVAQLHMLFSGLYVVGIAIPRVFG